MVLTRRQSRKTSNLTSSTCDEHLLAAMSSEKEQKSADSISLMPGAFDAYTSPPKASRARPLAFLSSITQRTPKTPKDKAPIKPAGIEMHPQLHYKSTAMPYDEARWLGFFNLGSQTAPPRSTATVTRSTPPQLSASLPSPSPVRPISQIPKLAAVLASAATPTSPSSLDSTTVKIPDRDPPPGFPFAFKRKASLELSPEAKQLMAESREEASKIRAQMVVGLHTVTDYHRTGDASGRKFAKAKGKASRYSDVHMAAFKKMDSIANHSSAWRTGTTRQGLNSSIPRLSPAKDDLNKSATCTLKRSSSKAELDKPIQSSLKRSPSKLELDAPSHNHLHLRPKLHLASTSKPATSHIPEGERSTAGPAKRVKCNVNDDAATTRPQCPVHEGKRISPLAPRLDGRQILFSNLPKPLSRAMTPTKASLARTQLARKEIACSNSVKNFRKVTSMISSLSRSESMKNLRDERILPSRIAVGFTAEVASANPSHVLYLNTSAPVERPGLLSPTKEVSMKSPPSVRKSFTTMKSILRTPQRLFSEDPVKIAAGTHVATPPDFFRAHSLSSVTPLSTKRVNFMASITDKAVDGVATAEHNESSPPITYPTLPILNSADHSTPVSHVQSRTLFTFRSQTRASFGSPKTATIRSVRSSNIGVQVSSSIENHRASPQKRKLNEVHEGEEEEKENQNAGEVRRAKKARMYDTPESHRAIGQSRLPRSNSSRSGYRMSATRLRMLATPKRR